MNGDLEVPCDVPCRILHHTHIVSRIIYFCLFNKEGATRPHDVVTIAFRNANKVFLPVDLGSRISVVFALQKDGVPSDDGVVCFTLARDLRRNCAETIKYTAESALSESNQI